MSQPHSRSRRRRYAPRQRGEEAQPVRYDPADPGIALPVPSLREDREDASLVKAEFEAMMDRTAAAIAASGPTIERLLEEDRQDKPEFRGSPDAVAVAETLDSLNLFDDSGFRLTIEPTARDFLAKLNSLGFFVVDRETVDRVDAEKLQARLDERKALLETTFEHVRTEVFKRHASAQASARTDPRSSVKARMRQRVAVFEEVLALMANEQALAEKEASR